MKMPFKDDEDGLTLNGSWYLAVSIVFFRPLLFQKSHFSEPSLITSQFSNLRYHPPPKKYQLSLWPNNPPLLHFHFSRGCLFHSHTGRRRGAEQSSASQVSGPAGIPIPSRNNHTHHLASQSHIPTTRDTLKQRTTWSGDQQSVITWYEGSCVKEEKRISLQLQESVDWLSRIQSLLIVWRLNHTNIWHTVQIYLPLINLFGIS